MDVVEAGNEAAAAAAAAAPVRHYPVVTIVFCQSEFDEITQVKYHEISHTSDKVFDHVLLSFLLSFALI